MMDNLIETNTFIKVDASGCQTEGSDVLLMENTLVISIEGELVGSIPYTPQHTEELVVGWLNDEGYISSASEIDSIIISEDNSKALVRMKMCDVQPGCSGSHERRAELKPVGSIPWKKEWIFRMAEDFEVQLPLRKLTMAAHNCRLAKAAGGGTTGDNTDIEILFKCEDIGRHSAIDKTIGWAMMNGIDISECILFTSGRISRAMVHKVIRAGIPVMAGKGTISGKAVELAREYGLTLIGYAKKDSLCIFNEGDAN